MKKSSKAARKALAHHAGKKHAALTALRREYCAARARYQDVGRELGRMTGAHKASKHRKRKCKVRSSR